MSVAPPKTDKQYPKARKDVREKVQRAKTLTSKQQLDVLVNARDLLSTNYGKADWVKLVNGVERFCLYGAVQQVCDMDPDSRHDDKVNQCGLTDRLFDAISDQNSHKKHVKDRASQGLYRDNHSLRLDKCWALQGLNDAGDKRSVLRVLDRAIKNIQEGQ